MRFAYPPYQTVILRAVAEYFRFTRKNLLSDIYEILQLRFAPCRMTQRFFRFVHNDGLIIAFCGGCAEKSLSTLHDLRTF